MVLPIAHEALSRWVMTLIVRVETLEKVVAAVKELASSLRVIEPGEISIIPGAIVLLRVDTSGHHRSREELQEGLQVVSWQTHRGIPCGSDEIAISPCINCSP
jgi:acetolactate synthase small subunit